MATPFSLQTKFDFGRYYGKTVKEVLNSDPGYVVYCIAIKDEFFLQRAALEFAVSKSAGFVGLIDENEKRLKEYERTGIHNSFILADLADEEFAKFVKSQETDDCRYDISYDSYCPPRYDEYGGPHGLSDDFINDVLEGDPSLYWNID